MMDHHGHTQQYSRASSAPLGGFRVRSHSMHAYGWAWLCHKSHPKTPFPYTLPTILKRFSVPWERGPRTKSQYIKAFLQCFNSQMFYDNLFVQASNPPQLNSTIPQPVLICLYLSPPQSCFCYLIIWLIMPNVNEGLWNDQSGWLYKKKPNNWIAYITTNQSSWLSGSSLLICFLIVLYAS